VTFYNEYEEPRSSGLRRRNRRSMIMIGIVVGLMVVAGVVGAMAASGSKSHNNAAADPTTLGTSATTKPNATKPKPSAKTAATTAPKKANRTGTTLSPAEQELASHLPPGVTLPKTATRVTSPPASPAVINAYIAAFRGECQAVWSHADADGLLWDPDDPGSDPHRISECYDAMDQEDTWLYDDIPDAQQYARDNVDSAVEDMTLAYRLRSTKGVVFDVP
jgi:hypothetical protein